MQNITTLFLGLWMCVSCSPARPGTEEFFAPSVTEVRVDVAYEDGAEPYTQSDTDNFDVWSITRDNLAELFAQTTSRIEVPSNLTGMLSLGELEANAFTPGDLADLGKRIWPEPIPANTIVFRALFLEGFLEVDGEPDDLVLGVSVGSTGVIAIFKPVVRSMQQNAPFLSSINARLGALFLPYVEQNTIVHELGHGVGLVDNGLPLTSDHYDEEADAQGNPNHCTNRDCVMYWTNNSSGSDLGGFVLELLQTGDVVLFGEECIQDALAAAESVREL